VAAEDPNDFQLLEAWRDGDASAGQQLARRHLPLLYRFFRTKLDAGVADAVQQTLLAAVSTRDRIRDGQRFRAYLLGVARNELLMIYRSRRIGPDRVDPGGSMAASGPTASGILADKREQRLLLAALRELPADMQIALELYYWEDLPTAEIAEIVGVAGGTIKSRLHRARELLRERIGVRANDEALARSTLADLDGWAASLRRRLRGPGDASDEG
jgi:RNA polymerase sigma-70 factor (ECF subfamily)